MCDRDAPVTSNIGFWADYHPPLRDMMCDRDAPVTSNIGCWADCYPPLLVLRPGLAEHEIEQ
jgi:hypothetical protein